MEVEMSGPHQRYGEYIGQLVITGFEHPRERVVLNQFGFKEFEFEDPLVPAGAESDRR
jgi:hypothetical protein